MTMPTVRAVGAKGEGTTIALTVPAPAGIATGDLEILVASTQGVGTLTLSANGGGTWTTNATFSPEDTTGGEKVAVWYRTRAGGDSDPQVTAGTDHVTACRIAVTAGTWDTTTPIEAWFAARDASSGTASSIATGVSTTVSDCLVFLLAANTTDTATGQGGTNTANTSLTSVTATPIANYWTANGAGGGFFVATGQRVAAGTTGTWTNTILTAAVNSYIGFAVRGAASAAAAPKELALTGVG